MKELDTIKLEDGLTYAIVETIEKDDNKYVYLANINDEKDFCIRKIILENNEEILIGLENDDEFKKALLYLQNKYE